MNEITGTVLSIVKDLAQNQVEIRDWSFSQMSSISDHLEAHEDRFDTIEQFGGETTLTPEDGEILARALTGAKYVAMVLFKGPFPIEERDEEGKQKLAEVLAHIDQAEKIVADSTLLPDDDEDDLLADGGADGVGAS